MYHVLLGLGDAANIRLRVDSGYDLIPANRELAGAEIELVDLPNREGRLPKHPRGYYREYTVPTPALRDRGPRRIVTGRYGELYYTDDHYRSFRRIIE